MNGNELSLALVNPGARLEWERAVLVRHRYGDEAAFEEIYRLYAPLVYNLTLRLSGNQEQALDLSQEVFVRVYQGLGRFRGSSSLKTWIYRVCLNHCRSRLGRTRRPEEPLSPADGVSEVVDPQRGPEELAVARDAQRLVASALLEVDHPYREALVLRDLEELSYQEIAEVIGVRIGTVRSRIARGREQLRRALEASAAVGAPNALISVVEP